MMEDLKFQQWYYDLEDQRNGPASTDDLLEFFEEGLISADTFIERSTNNDKEKGAKKPLREFTELFQYIQQQINEGEEDNFVITPGEKAKEQVESIGDNIDHSSETNPQEQQEQQEGDDMVYVESLGSYVTRDHTMFFNYQTQQWEPLSLETQEALNRIVQQSIYSSAKSSQSSAAAQRAQNKYDQELLALKKQQNASVFVSNLSDKVTVNDLVSYFSKYGIIQTKRSETSDEGVPMVRIYVDDSGKSLGSALITYLRKESVNLAIGLLDETEWMGTKISVKQATFSSPSSSSTSNPQGSESGETGKVSKRKSTTATEDAHYQQRKRAKKSSSLSNKNAQKLQWRVEDEEDVRFTTGAPSDDAGARQYIVILLHMFHPNDALKDPNFFVSLKEDVTEEMESYAPVERVKLFKNSRDGVIEVRFKHGLITDDQFHFVLQKFNGRYFAGRAITARSGNGREHWIDVEDDEESRHEAFGKSLEQI